MSATIEQSTTMVLKPTSGYDKKYDMKKEDWKLQENTEMGSDDLVLRLDSLLKEGESFVRGDIMLQRAKEIGSLAGHLHAQKLLGQQKDIPNEWRGLHLLFAGTVWCDSSERLYVPYVDKLFFRWRLRFYCLNLIFDSRCRLVRLGRIPERSNSP